MIGRILQFLIVEKPAARTWQASKPSSGWAHQALHSKYNKAIVSRLRLYLELYTAIYVGIQVAVTMFKSCSVANMNIILVISLLCAPSIAQSTVTLLRLILYAEAKTLTLQSSDSTATTYENICATTTTTTSVSSSTASPTPYTPRSNVFQTPSLDHLLIVEEQAISQPGRLAFVRVTLKSSRRQQRCS